MVIPPPLVPPAASERLGRAPASWPHAPPPGPSATDADLLRLAAVNPDYPVVDVRGGRAARQSEWLLPPVSRTSAVPPAGPPGTVHLILRHGQPALRLGLEIDASAGVRAAPVDPADAAVAEHALASRGRAEAGTGGAEPPAAVEDVLGAALGGAGLVRGTNSLAAGGSAAIRDVVSDTNMLESSLAATTGTVGAALAPEATR